MNAINRELLEHAAAMANIPHSLRDIYAMAEGKMKPTRKVIEFFKKLNNGEEITEMTEMTTEIRREIAVEQANIYDVKMHLILEYLAVENMTTKQLSEVTDLTIKKTSYLMQLLGRRNRVRSIATGGRDRAWTLYNDSKHNPVEIKTMTKIRKEAAEAGQKYYHGSPHPRCGNTLRLTSSGDCVTCQKERDSKRNRSKFIKNKPTAD